MSNRWRYYEGTTSANTIVRDLAKVLCTAVKDKEIKNNAGTVVKPSKVIQDNNWDIVYPVVDWDKITVDGQTVGSVNDLTPEEFAAKIDWQLDQSTDTIILKTTTTPINVTDDNSSVDDMGLDNDLLKDKIDMYIELYKPKYLADSEKYHPETERFGVKPYNVTREIYSEFASNYGTNDINILTTWGNREGDASAGKFIQTQKVDKLSDKSTIATLSGDYRPESITPTATNVKILYEALSGGSSVPLNSNGYTASSALGNAWYNISILNTEQKQALQTLAGSSISIGEYTQFYFYNYRSGSGVGYNTYSDGAYLPSYRQYVILQFKRSQLQYRIPVGAKVTLPFATSINPESIQLFVNKQPYNKFDGSTGYWNFNTVNGEFSVVAPIPTTGWTTLESAEQEPYITYQYEKQESVITGSKLLYNNHYIYVRMFDKINDSLNGPTENEIDESTGEISVMNSHVSEWSKLSWYQDYEEVMIDELDTDVGIQDLSQGVVLLPIETAGLSGDTRIRFWANTNNDRSVIFLMGNPSLDFRNNRHITSAMYTGKVESFDNSINDTAGNFALFTCSSSTPCSTKKQVNRVTINTSMQIGAGTGDLNVFTYTTDGKKFIDSNSPIAVTIIDNGVETVLDSNLYSVSIADDKTSITITMGSAPASGTQIDLSFGYYEESIVNINGIVRDSFGNILDIRYPTTWGINTSTGVTDISMYHTRSKAFFQKHHMMFTTTEEYMTKEMYGKSAYTGEYYADKVKVTHGNDGPRGILQDLLVIDQSSLIALDELIVNRDFSKDAASAEETYVYFPITAPFSPLAGSPNGRYGLAIKKEEVLPVPVTNEEAVERELGDLYIGKLTNITEDIILPRVLNNGVTVSWASSDEDVIVISGTDVITGEVTRPENGAGNATLTLTATLTKGSVTSTKVFNATVLEEGLTNTQAVAEAKAVLVISNSDAITSNINLPLTGLYGTSISWSSANTDAITNYGVITRPDNGDEAIQVVLTATISKGTINDTKAITITILPWSNAEEVDLAHSALNWDTIRGTNISEIQVTGDLVLSLIGSNGTTISWQSTKTNVIATNGTVTRPAFIDGDMLVTLTATITKGSSTRTKQFLNLKVLKLYQTNQEAVSLALASITEDTIKGANASLAGTTTNLVLPKTPDAGVGATTVSFTWDHVKQGTQNPSVYLDIVDNSSNYIGVVTRPAATEVNESVALTMTATSSLAGGASYTGTKTFYMSIAKLES